VHGVLTRHVCKLCLRVFAYSLTHPHQPPTPVTTQRPHKSARNASQEVGFHLPLLACWYVFLSMFYQYYLTNHQCTCARLSSGSRDIVWLSEMGERWVTFPFPPTCGDVSRSIKSPCAGPNSPLQIHACELWYQNDLHLVLLRAQFARLFSSSAID
jgi:hypothetical protein